MSSGLEYANRLEQWFLSAPDPVQQVLRPVFDPTNDLLKAVAGDPQDLVRAGQRYVDLGKQMLTTTEQWRNDWGMLAGAWEGEGYDAFLRRAEDIEDKLRQTSEATGSTQEVLEAAAQACVEGANLIIDVVVTLIAFAVSTFIIKAALAVFTFGASMAAWVAEQVAAGALALARVTQIVARVAQVLQRVAQIFERISSLLQRLADILRAVRQLLVALDNWKKGTKLLSLQGVGARGLRGLAYNTVNDSMLGGSVPRPGDSLRDIRDGVGDTFEARQDVQEAGQAPDSGTGGG